MTATALTSATDPVPAPAAAQAIWLVEMGLLDPAWIDTALSHPGSTPDDDWIYSRSGTGPYLAAALRELLEPLVLELADQTRTREAPAPSS